MTAYYNEIDPFKAEVIREAIRAGMIAPGYVDERSIADVRAAELVGYTQCHWFAGGGFWSYALRQAGWRDDREVWTGSCPCPSFSAAGKGEGFADPRHLWPEWARLIRERRPASLFGEQVAAAIGHGWLDLVSTDLEAEGYAVAAAVLGAHSVGAPHIRQRLYFVANADSQRYVGRRASEESAGITSAILPVFLRSYRLKPFISEELGMASIPIKFRLHTAKVRFCRVDRNSRQLTANGQKPGSKKAAKPLPPVRPAPPAHPVSFPQINFLDTMPA